MKLVFITNLSHRIFIDCLRDKATGLKRTLYNGVARTLKKIRTSNGDYWVKQWFHQLRPFSKWELLLKDKIASRGRLYGKLLFPHSVTSLECYYFITHVRNCVIGATPMFFRKNETWPKLFGPMDSAKLNLNCYVYPYKMDKSFSNFRVVRCVVYFIFI